MPFLLLREDSKTSLSTLVEKAQKKSPPLLEYDLQLNNGHLDLVLLSKPDRKINSTSISDEGFESDIDSLSIVSSDSFSTEKRTDQNGKTTETDSANGSSSSDSDTEVSAPEKPVEGTKESFNLVDCVCYTDVSCTDILMFVIRTEALVFKFENIDHLKTFYTSFTTLKAVANQKAYAKFKKDPLEDGPSSIISIDTPTKPQPRVKYNTINSKLGPRARIATKSTSIENILDLDQKVNKEDLRKVWNSAEDLLEPPKRPERRKKGRAPQPPPRSDVFSGQYVRVNVQVPTRDREVLRYEPKREAVTSATRRPRPRSETRSFVPMAYRYIDTTPHYHPQGLLFSSSSSNRSMQSINNRLFGLSSKLRELSSAREEVRASRWEAVGKEVGLKSVIKNNREESNKKKKVTFSAYTTVQVV